MKFAKTIQALQLSLDPTLHPPEIISALEHAVACAEISRNNRNKVAHAWISFGGTKLFKPDSPRGSELQMFNFDCEEMRQIADDAFAVGHYLMFVGIYITHPDHVGGKLIDKCTFPHEFKMQGLVPF